MTLCNVGSISDAALYVTVIIENFGFKAIVNLYFSFLLILRYTANAIAATIRTPTSTDI